MARLSKSDTKAKKMLAFFFPICQTHRMLTGAARLRQWIERSKLTQRETADLLGVDETFLSQLLNGHRQPGLTNAIRIERTTGIAVESWLPIEGGSSSEPVTESVGRRRSGKA